MFIANGITFVTSALFNNLGKPQWATYFNLGKATFGTFPFIWVGGYYYGPEGVLIGMMISFFRVLLSFCCCAAFGGLR